MNYRELADMNKMAEQENAKLLEEAQRPAKKKSGVMADFTEPGDNSVFLSHALAAWDLPRVDTKNPKEVESRILMYFNYCIEHDVRPQMVGMASWLGVSRQTLLKWRTGQMGDNKEIMEKAFNIMESLWADYMQNGKINPVTGIFLGKAWYGYRDQTEYIVTPNTQNTDTSESLLEEAKMLPGLEE